MTQDHLSRDVARLEYVCDGCGTISRFDQLLRAQHPFIDSDSIVACPVCREIGYLSLCCDEPGCAQPVACGTRTSTGYRSTCSLHAPEVTR